MQNTGGTTKRRGRPPKDPSEVKRHNVTIAMAEPSRRAIQEAAERNGRSVSSEIDFRLGMSLALDADAGSPAVRRLLDFTRLAATKLQAEAGRDWIDDEVLASALIGALAAYVRGNSPASKEDAMEVNLREIEEHIIEQQPLMEQFNRGERTPERAKAVMDATKIVMQYATIKRIVDNVRERKEARGASSTEELARLFQIRNQNGRAKPKERKHG